jgi:hypothetical protein
MERPVCDASCCAGAKKRGNSFKGSGDQNKNKDVIELLFKHNGAAHHLSLREPD